MSYTLQQSCALGWLQRDPRPWSPDDLALALDTSREGAAATASSLVRRGEVRRLVVRGRVFYQVKNGGQ